MNRLVLVSTSVAALMLFSPAFAQGRIVGTTAIDDRITDIEADAAREIARSEDRDRFGNPEMRLGLSGSASLSYAAQSGNTEAQDVTIGARLRHSNGKFVQTLGFAVEFNEQDGASTAEDLFAVYDANYYLTDRFYLFALGRVNTDGLAEVSADPANTYQTDAFVGVGPGVRIVNTDTMAWRLQAGVGVSYLENGLGDTEQEVGYLAGSRFYYRFTDTIFATNDTDILKSDTALRINNDLGVNFRIAESFSTRVSYLTEFNDARAIKTDNKLGVAVVYGF